MIARNLHVLLASDHYPPFIGGAHRQTQLLAHDLDYAVLERESQGAEEAHVASLG